ncbi:hypothetical protein ColLi_09172 [Colletotrichum liriopes]|uniref:F-box domain-containing protein n=1 Tax=Colletotrichum liriopes TaxID=708192 RepID=A0AA37LVI5_9PEZI|nr:hypothetical protein ColLi_09172 [Colletotrichum liriopes]
MDKLPGELLIAISRYASVSDLRSIIRVNRTTHSAAESLIVRRAVLDDGLLATTPDCWPLPPAHADVIRLPYIMAIVS